jgi:hypothetical protein
MVTRQAIGYSKRLLLSSFAVSMTETLLPLFAEVVHPHQIEHSPRREFGDPDLRSADASRL